MINLKRARRFLIWMILVCSGSAFAQETGGPKLVVKEDVFEFGERMKGSPVVHIFKVLNQGDQTLEIQQVKPG